MSFLDEILKAGRETIQDIKNIPSDIKQGVSTIKKSIFEEVEAEQKINAYIAPDGKADPFKSKFYVPKGEIRGEPQKTAMLGGEMQVTPTGVIKPWNEESQVPLKDIGITLGRGTVATTSKLVGDAIALYGSKLKNGESPIPTLSELFFNKGKPFIATPEFNKVIGDSAEKYGDILSKKSVSLMDWMSEGYSEKTKESRAAPFSVEKMFTPEFWLAGDIVEATPGLVPYIAGGRILNWALKIPKTAGVVTQLTKAVIAGSAMKTAESLQNASDTYRSVYESSGDTGKATQDSTAKYWEILESTGDTKQAEATARAEFNRLINSGIDNDTAQKSANKIYSDILRKTGDLSKAEKESDKIYNDVFDSTKSRKKATEAANSVIEKSRILYATEPLQFALDFMPGGDKGVMGKLLKLAASTTMEVGEELYQTYIQGNEQRKIEGKTPQTFGELIKSPEGQNVIATTIPLSMVGNLAGQYGLHAGYTQDREAIKDAEKNFTPEQKQEFDQGMQQGEEKLKTVLQDIKDSVVTPADEQIVKESLTPEQLSLFESLPEKAETPIYETENEIGQEIGMKGSRITYRPLTNNTYYIETITTDKAYRRQKRGTKVFDALLAKAKANNVEYIVGTETASGDAFFEAQVREGKISRVDVATYAEANNITLKQLKTDLGFDTITDMKENARIYDITPDTTVLTEAPQAGSILEQVESSQIDTEISQNFSEEDFVYTDKVDRSEEAFFYSDVKRIKNVNPFKVLDSDALTFLQSIFDKYGVGVKIQTSNKDYYNQYIENIQKQYEKSFELIYLYDSIIERLEAYKISQNRDIIYEVNSDIRNYLPFNRKIRSSFQIDDIIAQYRGLMEQHIDFVIKHEGSEFLSKKGDSVEGFARTRKNPTTGEFEKYIMLFNELSDGTFIHEFAHIIEPLISSADRSKLREIYKTERNKKIENIIERTGLSREDVINALDSHGSHHQSEIFNIESSQKPDQNKLQALKDINEKVRKTLQEDGDWYRFMNEREFFAEEIKDGVFRKVKKVGVIEKFINFFKDLLNARRRFFNKTINNFKKGAYQTQGWQADFYGEKKSTTPPKKSFLEQIQSEELGIVPQTFTGNIQSLVENADVAMRNSIIKTIKSLQEDIAQLKERGLSAKLEEEQIARYKEQYNITNEKIIPTTPSIKNPFTGETTTDIQALYEQGNSEAIAKSVGEEGVFVVDQSDTAPQLDSSTFIRMTDAEYERSGLPKLQEGQVAYKIYSPFTDTVIRTGNLQLKSGLGMQKGKTFKNLGIALAQVAHGALVFDMISPALTLSPKFSIGILKFLGVKNILGLIIDPKTGYDGRAIEQQSTDKAVVDRLWMMKKFGGAEKVDQLFSLSEDLSKAWIKLAPKIRDIISTTDTKNSLTGQDVIAKETSEKEINNMVSSVLARAAYNYSYDALSEYNQSEKETLKINDAISHMVFYYPNETKAIIGDDLYQVIYDNLDMSRNQLYDASDFGGRILVQKGKLKDNELGGIKRKFVTVAEMTEADVVERKDAAYEPYVINRNDAINIFGTDIPAEFDTIEEYVDYLTAIRNTNATETNTGKNIDAELNKFKDTILKSKGADSIDFFRLKSPVGQMLHYSNHVSRVVYQDSMVKLFAQVERLLPGNLKTKLAGNYIGLIEDTFSTTFRPKGTRDIGMDEAIYGSSKTPKGSARTTSFVSALNQGTAFAFATLDNMTQALGTLFILFPNPKIYTTKLKGTEAIEKLFIENSVGASRKVDGKVDESFMKRNTLARIRAAQAKQETWNNTAPAFDKDGNFSWVNTRSVVSEKLGLMPLIGFGNTMEQAVSHKAAILTFAETMEKVNDKKYINKLTIDGDALAKDFNEMTNTEKEKVLNATKKTITKNFSAQRTGSSIKLMNLPGMNVLRGWVTKFVAAQTLRRLDERSFFLNNVSLDTQELIEALPMQKELKEANKFMIQYTNMFAGITMGLATTIFLKSLKGGEDEEEKKNLMITSVLTAWNWMGSGLLDLDGLFIRIVSSPISTSTGFTTQFTSSLKDLIMASISGNDFALTEARRNIVRLTGMLGQIINSVADFNDSISHWTSFGNITNTKKNTIGQIALDNLLPGSFDAAKSKAIEFTLKNATEDRSFILDMAGQIASMRAYQAEMSFKNMFGPLFKVATGKQGEAFEKAQVIQGYYDYIAENGQSKPFSEVSNEYIQKNSSFYQNVPFMKNIRDYASTRSKESLKLAKAFEDVDFLKERGFSYAQGESAIATLNRIRENTEIEAALAEKLIGLSNRSDDSMDKKEYAKKSISSPDSRSSTMSALALVNENNKRVNSLARAFNTYFFTGEENTEWYDMNAPEATKGIQTISGSQQMLEDMEAILALAGANPMVEQDVMTSLQIVGAKNVKTRLYKLSELGLLEPDKYPNVMKAFIKLQDESTVSYSEYLKPSKFDYEVVDKINKPLEKEVIDIPRAYDEGANIEAPYYGIVQVDNGKVLIRDALGRAFTFTNIDTDMKGGDVVEPGTKVGTVKKGGTVTNRFNKKGEAENLNNELLPLIKSDGIFSPSYLKSLAINPIDFYALSRNIKQSNKNKVGSEQKSITEGIKISPRKSILEEILSNS